MQFVRTSFNAEYLLQLSLRNMFFSGHVAFSAFGCKVKWRFDALFVVFKYFFNEILIGLFIIAFLNHTLNVPALRLICDFYFYFLLFVTQKTLCVNTNALK